MKRIYNNTIDCRYFEEGTQPTGWVPGSCKINYKLLFDVAEVLDYYHNHSTYDTAKYFDCKKEKLIKFLLENNIVVHSRAEDVAFSNLKRAETCLDTYGVSHVMHVPDVKARVEATNTEKYGAKTYLQTDEFIQYNKTIQQERYGGMGGASPTVSQKIRQSTKDRYGTECIFTLESFVEQNMKSQRARYGGVGFESRELADKGIATALNNYNLSTKQELNQLIKIRQEATTLEKYGVRHYAQSPEFFKKLKKKYLYHNIYFDTIPELALYIYFTDNNIPITRNTDIYFEFTYNDTTHRYYPDFVSTDGLLEVKGDHFFKEDGTMCNPYDHTQDGLYEAKHQCGLQNKVKFITSNSYTDYIKYCKEKFNQSNWYINFREKGDDANEKNG